MLLLKRAAEYCPVAMMLECVGLCRVILDIIDSVHSVTGKEVYICLKPGDTIDYLRGSGN